MSLIGESLTYRFPGDRALKLIKNGVNMRKSSNFLILTKNISLTISDCCTPGSVRLADHSIGTCVVSMVYGAPAKQRPFHDTRNYFAEYC